jgi:hypothetical protein
MAGLVVAGIVSFIGGIGLGSVVTRRAGRTRAPRSPGAVPPGPPAAHTSRSSHVQSGVQKRAASVADIRVPSVVSTPGVFSVAPRAPMARIVPNMDSRLSPLDSVSEAGAQRFRGEPADLVGRTHASFASLPGVAAFDEQIRQLRVPMGAQPLGARRGVVDTAPSMHAPAVAPQSIVSDGLGF